MWQVLATTNPKALIMIVVSFFIILYVPDLIIKLNRRYSIIKTKEDKLKGIIFLICSIIALTIMIYTLIISFPKIIKYL